MRRTTTQSKDNTKQHALTSGSAGQEAFYALQRNAAYVMLGSLCIHLGGLQRYPDADEKAHQEFMPAPRGSGSPVSLGRKRNRLSRGGNHVTFPLESLHRP